MSYSHADVGHAFASAKKSLGGSRMSTYKPNANEPMILSNTQFELLAYGISYRTTVCKHVLNRVTNQHELWVTPQYFSQSTQRHVGYFRAGFIKAHGVDNIFTTPAASSHGSYISRDDKLFAQNSIKVASAMLSDVDLPRVREATRRGHLAAALTRLDSATRNMSKGIALDRVDADTLYDLQGTMHFVEMLMDTDDIDEVRAAVRAHIALNHPANNR
jgi:hypothetical protein